MSMELWGRSPREGPRGSGFSCSRCFWKGFSGKEAPKRNFLVYKRHMLRLAEEVPLRGHTEGIYRKSEGPGALGRTDPSSRDTATVQLPE